jgi:hypothetical protein
MSISHLIEYLNKNEPTIHKFYSIENGWMILSDRNGTRYKLTNMHSLAKLETTIDKIKKARFIPNKNKIVSE